MGRIHNFVLNGAFGTGADHSKTFNIDWDKMPSDCSYKLTFAFTSNGQGDQFTQVANLYCNLGQSHNIVCSSDNFNNTSGIFLGFLRPLGFPITGTNYGALYADINTNPPTFLYRRPQQTSTTVFFHTSVSTTANYTNATGNYTLILSFEELD